MQVRKVRFLEPGAPPYHRTPLNLFVYDRYIRTPSVGQLTLATIVRERVPDTFMYSESISKIQWGDVLDADIVFISAFTFAAPRGYELADKVRRESEALVVIGGLHATMCPEEAAQHCDYVMLGEGDESILQLLDALEADARPEFEGVAWLEDGMLRSTGMASPPHDIDTIPDRSLLYRYKKMAGHNTIWGQVHASRGCPHNCDYCALVRLYGHGVRTRSLENVVEDIRRTIAFHDEGHHRIAKMLWITDDNFFANRTWALQMLQAIIDSDIDYRFTIQARYEVGFDDEMLDMLARAGFAELSMGIEFIDDAAFEEFHKKSTHDDIVASIRNIQSHGMHVRGLFIFGAESNQPGIGKRVADFVIDNDIRGILLQSMYFAPGTPAYSAYEGELLHKDWNFYNGCVVHNPRGMSPVQLQREVIACSKRVYSLKRLAHALVHYRGLDLVLFLGEFFWQMSERANWRKNLKKLRALEA